MTVLRVRHAAGMVCAVVLAAAPEARAAPAAASGFRVLYAEPVTIAGLPAAPASKSAAHRAAASGVAAAPTRAYARFDAYGRRFDLALEPNDRLAPALAAEPGAPRVYRGALDGVPGSWVRLTLAGERRWGMVWDGRELYVIEPADEAAASLAGPAPASGAAALVYRLSDTVVADGAAACGVREAAAPTAGATSGLDAYRQLAGELGAAGPGSPAADAPLAATRRLEVTLVADHEFVRAVGVAGARDRMVARFNNVDGIFSAQLGVQVQVVGPIVAYETPTQPFGGTTDAKELLAQVGAYRMALPVPGGVTHLVTGRDVATLNAARQPDFETVGIAYIGTLCSPLHGASLSEGQNSWGTLVAAHELGHNFGAPHDGEGACAAVTDRSFLMAARVTGSDKFSSCSLAQLRAGADAATCLVPVVARYVDLAASAAQKGVDALAGRAFSIVTSVNNLGNAATAGARVQFAVPSELAVVDGTATGGGACAPDAGGLACTWPALAGGDAATVTVTLKGAAPTAQPLAVTATAIAVGDATPANDAVTYGVSVHPPPDLELTAPLASSAVDVERTFAVAVNVANRGAVQVDVTEVRFALPPVVAIATAPTGCLVGDALLTCTLAALRGGESRTLGVTLRGTAPGTGTVEVTLASPEDGTPANNRASVAVSVRTAAAAVGTPPTATADGGSGGGGALGLELLGLAALGAARRRRRP